MLNQKLVEQRRHLRVSVHVRYCLTIDGQEFYGTTGNISFGGAFLETVEPAMLTSFSSKTASLKLEAPGNPIVIDCKAVYVDPKQVPFRGGVGIVFCNPDEAAISAIRNLLMQELYGDSIALD